MERDLCRTEAHAPSSAFREGILLQRLRASLVHAPLHRVPALSPTNPIWPGSNAAFSEAPFYF